MYLLLYAAWLILNARITLEIALVGLVVCGAVYAFCCAFLDFGPRKEIKAIGKVFRFVLYCLFMVVEIVKSNLKLIGIILGRREVKQQIVKFKTPLKSKNSRVLLANSITLTPGTITVGLADDRLTVHCLDFSLGEGIEDSLMQSKLRRLEK